MKTTSSLAALVAGVAAVETHIAAYQQCGGNSWTGASKACVTGFHCKQYNEWYSQCIPGAANSSAISNSTSCTTTVTLSRNSSAAPVTTSEVSSSVPRFGSISLTYSTSTDNTGTGVATASEVAPASSTSLVSPVEATSSVASSSKSIYKATITAAAPSSAATSISVTLSTAYKVASSIAVSNSTAPSSTASASSTIAAVSSNAAATGSYPTTSGTEFVINGTAGYFAGTNAYWIGFLTDNADVDLVMSHLAASGLKVLRVWGFNDVTSTPGSGTVYFQSFAGSEPTINTGADGLERLDYVVTSAEAHGIKLIINFVNNWTDYGGMAAYFTYAGITDNTQWYNNTKAQTQYQAYIKAVVSRYPSSSAIFAWELANEPRCTGCDSSVMNTWITTTAAYIKSLDANHMVTLGGEGFGLTTGDDGTYPYSFDEGTDFALNCAVADIDFCGYHLYPESWGVTPTLDWGNAWIESHAKACVAAGKPCLMEEFGASNNCTIESAWQATALKTTGTGADLFWQYGDTLSTGQTAQDGNTAYYGDAMYTCLVTNHIAAIDAA